MLEKAKIEGLRCPKCGNPASLIKKNGVTKRGTQRYKCICGKTFILTKDKKKPSCPDCIRCGNNIYVIKWGDVKDKYGYIRYRKSRYYCKKHKTTFTVKTCNFDEVAVIKAYLAGGDIALREFIFDETGNQIPFAFVAVMEILQEYRESSEHQKGVWVRKD